MQIGLLEILRCPFCGDRLELQPAPLVMERDGAVEAGILFCQCCAYPIVAGIPCIVTGSAAETVMELIGQGQNVQALFTLLGLDETKQEQFKPLLEERRQTTFREALAILSADAEGTYLEYRFSDPTFLSNRAVVQAIGQARAPFTGRVLDLCGGTGHLTRSLIALKGTDEVLVTDISFAKLWLAKRFIAPQCQPICSDANQALPFAKNTFSLVVCSDAFHYIWCRRALACEMARLMGENGVIILPHLHNALSWNYSDGMPLTPNGYRNLFDDFYTRIFKQSAVLDAVVNRQAVDLSVDYSDKELEQEPALILIASRAPDLFQLYEYPYGEQPATKLAVNPLYQMEQHGERLLLKLRFPSDFYEMEFGDCKRYLPEEVELTHDKLECLRTGRIDGELIELAKRHVLLDLPEDY